MHRCLLACACVALAGCPSPIDGLDSGPALADAADPLDAPALDVHGGEDAWTRDGETSDASSSPDAVIAADAPTDAEPPLPLGALTVSVPSDAAPGPGLALRVFHPGTAGARYGVEGAPVAVILPGGHSPGSLDPESRTDPHVRDLGYVVVEVLLPGGSSEGGASGGRYDFRGPDCKRAAADAALWAMGRLRDASGRTLRDHVPFARQDLVGLVGSSNGGNLALTTMADHGDELSGLAFFVAWESPVGDQYWAGELQSGGMLNPYYTPGVSSPTSVPWPGLSDALDFDPAATTMLSDPRGGMVRGTGAIFVDGDGDGSLEPGELSFRPVGVALDADGALFGAPSHELAMAIDAASGRLFATTPRPTWLPTTAGVDAFWAGRDGSLRFAEVHAALPELIVLSLGSLEDHVQRTPDHPHVRGHVQGWLDAGHAFVRLNPDAAYMAEASRLAESAFPDNAANTPVPYPGIDATLEPEMVGATRIDAHLIPAAIAEAADRTLSGNLDLDLDAVLVSR